MDIIGGVAEDCAKGLVKNAAREVFCLGTTLGPAIAQADAYQWFMNLLGK